MVYKYDYYKTNEPYYFTVTFGEGSDAIDIGRLTDGITNITRNIGTDSDINPSDREIEIDFLIIGDYHRMATARREFSRALRCGKNGKKLVFNDEPNLYYIAKPKGDITLNETIGKQTATGKIKFTILEAKLYSNYTKKLQMDTYTTQENSHGVPVTFTRVGNKVTATWNWQNQTPNLNLVENADWHWGLTSYVNGYMPPKWYTFNAALTVYDSKGNALPDKWCKITRGGGPEIGYKGNNITNQMRIGGTATWYTTDPVPATGKVSDSAALGSIGYDPQTKSIKAKLINEGSRNAYPIIKFEHPKQNGYIGISSQNGVLALGSASASNRGIPTEQSKAHTEQLLNFKTNDPTWAARFKPCGDKLKERNKFPWSEYVGIATNQNDAKLVYSKPLLAAYPHQNYGLRLDARLLKGDRDWAVVPYSVELPADSNGEKGAVNWRADFNIKVWQHVLGMTGVINLSFCDEWGEAIASYDIAKDDTSGDDCRVKLRTNNKVYHEISFSPDNNEQQVQSDRHNVGFNSEAGACAIVKEGANITFYYAGKPYTINEPLQEYRVCKQIILSIGDTKKETREGYRMAILYLESLSFTKTDAKTFAYAENKFASGSVTTVDGWRGQIFYTADPIADAKGINAADLKIIGSTGIYLPPGESEIDFFFSDWIELPPNISIEWREEWM